MNKDSDQISRDNEESGGESARSTVRPGTASYEELAERLRTIGVADDGLAENIARNWQKVIGAVVVVLLGVWVVTEYRSAQRASRGEASTAFSDAQELYTSVTDAASVESETPPASPDKSKPEEDRLKGLSQSLSSLSAKERESSYGQLAKLYAASLALSEGKLDEARAQLSNFNISPYWASGKRFDPQVKFEPKKIFDEYAALLYARSLLQDEAKRSEGREKLAQLAFSSQVVGPEAAIALIRSATSDEERRIAEETARTLYQQMEASPRSRELAKMLQDELEQLGLTVSTTG